MSLAAGAGAELWYHGDFDWPGVAIAADVLHPLRRAALADERR